MPRCFHPGPLQAQLSTLLSPAAARHAQVLRLQPQDPVQLFNGEGGEWSACIEQMGRKDVQVRVLDHLPLEREALNQVVLAVGMPANERMDWLVEKATELGVHRITPLMTERSVIRLTGERAEKKQAHWQAVAASASEQCGRNRVPVIGMPERLDAWLARQTPQEAMVHGVLSLHASTQPLNVLRQGAAASVKSWVLLNGPEGGLTDAEDAAARAKGFVALSLGERVLRAETAALAALVALTLA